MKKKSGRSHNLTQLLSKDSQTEPKFDLIFPRNQFIQPVGGRRSPGTRVVRSSTHSGNMTDVELLSRELSSQLSNFSVRCGKTIVSL